MDRVNASPDETRAIYARQAVAYDTKRSRALFEARWLARFSACLPARARVLDLGCGAGEPIAHAGRQAETRASHRASNSARAGRMAIGGTWI